MTTPAMTAASGLALWVWDHHELMWANEPFARFMPEAVPGVRASELFAGPLGPIIAAMDGVRVEQRPRTVFLPGATFLVLPWNLGDGTPALATRYKVNDDTIAAPLPGAEILRLAVLNGSVGGPLDGAAP